MPRPLLLELEDVSRVAEGGTLLLSNICFRLRAGERWAVHGRSGSGKSLFLRTLARLDASTGNFRYQDHRLASSDIPAFRSQVIYLSQTPSLPLGNVEAALREPFHWKANAAQRYDRNLAEKLLQRFGRGSGFLTKSTTDLSGGEAGLAALMRALLLEPLILLLDEPTAAMDPETTRLVEGMLVNWVQEQEERRGYVWVTHQVDQAARIADRRLEIREGGIVEDERLL